MNDPTGENFQVDADPTGRGFDVNSSSTSRSGESAISEQRDRDILELLEDSRNDGFLNYSAAKEIRRLRTIESRLKEVAHDGKHDPGDYPYTCLGCRAASILEEAGAVA